MPETMNRMLWIGFTFGTHSNLLDTVEKATGVPIDLATSLPKVLGLLNNPAYHYAPIILDIGHDIDEANGFKYIQMIRQAAPDNACILLLPRENALRMKALEAGVYRILEKPVDPNEIVTMARLSLQYARLRTANHALSSTSDLHAIQDTLIQAVLMLTQADEAILILHNPDTDQLERHPSTHTGADRYINIFAKRRLTREILSSGKAVVIDDLTQTDPLDQNFAKTGIRSLMGVPCCSAKGVHGVLYAFSRQPSHFERWEYQRFLTSLAQQAGIALANARVLNELSAHSRNIDQLVEIGKKLTRAKSVEQQLDLAWEYVSHELKVATFFIGLYDREQGLIEFKKFVDKLTPVQMPNRILTDDRRSWGLAGYVVKTGEEVFWPTLAKRTEFCTQHHIESVISGEPSVTGFYLPLQLGNTIIGVASIQSYTPYAFDANQLNAFRSLVAQLAVTIENERLLEQERKRSFEAEVLRQAALRVAEAQPDEELIAAQILQELKKVVPYDCASVQLLMGSAEDLHFRIIEAEGFPNREKIIGYAFPASGDNPNRLILRSHRHVILPDAPASYPDFGKPPHDQAGIRSWLGVPMMAGEKLVGIVDLDKREPDFYTEAHAQLVGALAAQAGLAIRNVQLYKRKGKFRRYFEAGTELLAISDPNTMLQKIVEKVCQVTGAFRAVIFEMYEDTAGRHYNPLASLGFSKSEQDKLSIREDGISWDVFHSQKPKFIESVAQNDPLVSPKLFAQGVRAVAYLPLIAAGKSIGVLCIHFEKETKISKGDQSALTLFAELSSNAYLRVRTDQQTSQALDGAASVAQISALGHPEVTYKAIALRIKRIMRCDSVILYPYDEESDQFDFPPTTLGIEDSSLKSILALGKVSQNSVVRQILDLESAHESENAQTDPLLLGNFERQSDVEPFVRREKIGASISFPLRVGMRKVGVLFINFLRRRAFTTQDRITAALFANQAAIAIHNAQLVKQAARSAQLLTALTDTGTDYVDRSDLDTILNSVTRQASNLTGNYGEQARLCSLSLVVGEAPHRKLVFQAVYPPQAKERIDPANYEIDLDSDGRIGICGLAVTTKQSILSPDVHAPAYRDYYLVFDPNTESELAVPILWNNTVIGVLNVEHTQKDAFDEEDQDALESLARQAAIAIHNARELEDQPARTQLAHITTDLLATTDPKQVLQMIADSIRQYAKAWRAVALLIDPIRKDHQSILAQSGFDTEYDANFPLRPSGISMAVMESGKPDFRPDIRQGDPPANPLMIAQGVQSAACLPLTVEGKRIGVVWIHFREPHPFSREEEAALTFFVNQSALTYDYARRREESTMAQENLERNLNLAMMGMVNSHWRHSVFHYAVTTRTLVDMLRKELAKPAFDPELCEQHLADINTLANCTMQSVITETLSPNEGVESIDLGEFLADWLAQFQSQEKARRVQLRQDFPKFDRMVIRANPEWLRRALSLLMDNAIEALTSQPNPLIYISLVKSADRAWAEIRLTDNGRGIPEEQRKFILKKPVPKTADERGMGTGLLMTRMIVETYNGKIELASTGSQGTTFLIRFPLSI